MAEESKIEKAVCDYARKKGCYVRKFKSTSQRGVPDRLFITPKGIVFFIEFKAPGKKPNGLQRREIDLIQERGGNASWCDNAHAGKFIVDTHIE